MREMMAVARAEKNAILRNAQETAAAMLLEARDASPPQQDGSISGRHRTWQLDGHAAV